MKNRNLNHNDNWQTPPHIYKQLNKVYGFDFDPCPLNHDLRLWDGLEVRWGKINFVNPPYSNKKATGYLKSSFIKKAVSEVKTGSISICLLPVSTSTKLFHEVIKPNATIIHEIEGRIPFIGMNDKGQFINHHLLHEIIDRSQVISYNGCTIPKYIKAAGQHDSMLVVFEKKHNFQFLKIKP